jgi:DNA-directed RNA polymerase specialized sigma24 family protein
LTCQNKSVLTVVYSAAARSSPCVGLYSADRLAVSTSNLSFEAVVLPHLGAAYNLARWLMRDPGAAEDVVQDAMVRALIYFPSFREVNARGWLLQMSRLWRARRLVMQAAAGQRETSR